MGELDGKVAIITGAGRMKSIGRATAVHLAKMGADVVVTGTGRSPDRYPDEEKAVGWRDIESTAEQVREQGRKALPLVVDVTNHDQVQMMIDRTIEEFGRVDILINNAAFARGPDRVPIGDLKDELFKLVMDIKVTGTYFCTKAVLPHIISQGDGGKIVNISSTAGKRGAANTLAYNAANFAIVGMTQSMAAELGKYKINVNCVCPGAVETYRMDDLVNSDRWEQMAANTPIGRNGTDEETGGLVAYLCSEAASWIHGQSININGGTVMEH